MSLVRVLFGSTIAELKFSSVFFFEHIVEGNCNDWLVSVF